MAIVEDVNELQLRQSWRYGHDRLYATDAKGAVLGWWDASSREIRVRVAERSADVVSLIGAWLAREERLQRAPSTSPRFVSVRIARPGFLSRRLRAIATRAQAALRVPPVSTRPLAV